MQVRGDFTVQAEQAAVWESLFRDDSLPVWVPGGKRVAWAGDGRIEATVEQSLIGYKILMDLVLAVVAKEPPHRLAFRGRGEDSLTGSQVDFELEVALSPAADGTLVHYSTDATLKGRLAMIGEFVLRTRAKEIQRELAASVKRALEAGGRGEVP
jgi:carbon monoxide dehydrogenase subunit G